MRQLIPVFVTVICLVALATMIWVLFDTDDYNSELPDLDEQSREEQEREVISMTPVEPDEEPDRELIPSEGTSRRQVEQLKPELSGSAVSGGINLNVAYLKNSRPVENEDLKFQVLYNDVPINKIPKPSRQAGSYTLDDLMPGSYEVHAYTSDWMQGTGSCDLPPDSRADLTVFIDAGDRLEIQVIDSVTENPVQNARLQARGFVQGGLTNEEGRFHSARKYVPDGDLSIQISHPSYFNLLFLPIEPEKCGAVRIGPGYKYLIRMTPLDGDLSLSGTIVDDRGEAIQRLALFLSPEGNLQAQGSTTTYTNRAGTFSFSRLQPGQYRLRATLRFLVSHYLNDPPCFYEEVYTLLPGQSLLDLKIECVLPRTPLKGFVFLASSYQPARSATVSYESNLSGSRTPGGDESGLTFEPVTTDALGWFSTSETFLAEDIYRMIVYGYIKVSPADGEPSFCRPRKTPEGLRQMQADILAGMPISLWVVAPSEKVLTGTVTDPTGSAISGVRVTADSQMDIAQGRLRAYTDENGSFQISNLFPGQWIISAILPKGPAVRRDITIVNKGNPPPLNIRVENTCSVEGEILTDKEPGRWSIRVRGLGYETESQKIGSKFWYSFKHLPPGRAQIILEVYDGRRYQESYLSVQEAWVELEKGKVVRRDFSL